MFLKTSEEWNAPGNITIDNLEAAMMNKCSIQIGMLKEMRYLVFIFT